MKLIITHAGTAHRDDLFACCLLLALYPGTTIERRNPTANELLRLDVCVVDVGGSWIPEAHNYDHHQMEPAAGLCALSLVLGNHLNSAREILPWLQPLEILDTQGPQAMVDFLGVRSFADQVIPVMSPVDEFLLEEFSRAASVSAHQWLHAFMQRFGASIWNRLNSAVQRLNTLREVTELHEVKGRKVMLVNLDRAAIPIYYLEHFTRKHFPDVAVTVTQDPRGDGWSLYRRAAPSATSVNFLALEGYVGVSYVHPGGFVAKTDQLYELDRVLAMIEIAIDGKPAETSQESMLETANA